MRLLTAAGFVVLSAAPGLAAYVVELDAGDRMTVDSYWEDGGRVHLMRGGVDLNVPKSRIRSMKRVDGAAEAGVRGTAPAPVSAPAAPPAPSAAPAAPPSAPSASAAEPQTRDDMEAQQRRIEHHLLKVQRERFEAKNRGDSAKTLKRLDKEFQRTQQRRIDSMKKLANSPAS